jgi:CheY-like chemotaxis protein
MIKPLIVIVEDDQDILDNLSVFLEEEGYLVEVATDGEMGLSALAGLSKTPYAILLDIMMPGMDGIEFLHRLKTGSDPVLASIPVIVMSAAPLSGPRELSVRPWLVGLLKKPFALTDVLTLLSRINHKAVLG